MQIENELKFKIDKFNKPLKEKIAGLGFEFEEEMLQHDYYFSPPHKKFSGTKKYYLRLRKRADGTATFAYHVVVSDLQTKELELVCDDFMILKKILIKLDFKLDCIIKKRRQVFFNKNNNFNLVIDNVANLGCFMEIEYVGKMTKNINHIFQEMVNSIGLKKNQIISGCGYPDLLMKKK